MPLTTQDLESLAKLYGITTKQLQHSPSAADMIAFLDRAQGVIESLSAEDLARWIEIGESLGRR